MKVNYIDIICKKYNINSYKINSDNSIDVIGDVKLKNLNLNTIPLKFNNVYGDFDCSENDLCDLKGSPKYVDGNFLCSGNCLTSLKYSPEYINGYFDFSYNFITTLEDGPMYVKDFINCVVNHLSDNIKLNPKKYLKVYSRNRCIDEILK